MVSRLNGSLSDENSMKLTLENGHCSLSSPVLVKYKRRRVSAVRDFPQGCGRDVLQINMNRQETVVAMVGADKVPDAVVADGTRSPKLEVESVCHEMVGGQVQVEMDNSLNDLGKVVANAETIDGEEILPTDVQPLGTAPPNSTPELLKESHMMEYEAQILVKEELCDQEEVPALVKETVSKEEAVQSILKEELQTAEIQEMVKDLDGPENKPVSEIGNQSDVAVPLASEKLSYPPQLHISDVNIPQGTGPKKKYTRRSVSAIRNFPPFCGRNALRKTVVDQVRIDSGKESLVRVEKVSLESGASEERLEDGSSGLLRAGADELEGKVQDDNAEKSESTETVNKSSKQSLAVSQKTSEDVGVPVENVGKEIVVYSHEESVNRNISPDLDLGGDLDCMIAQTLMAAPLRQVKVTDAENTTRRSKAKKRDSSSQEKSKVGTNLNSGIARLRKKSKKNSILVGLGDRGDLGIKGEDNFVALNDEKNVVAPDGRGPRQFDVNLPPFGPNSSSHRDARNRVRESLRLFQAICRKLLQGEEAKSGQGEQAKSKQQGKDIKRIDLVAAKIVKEKGKEVNTDKHILGEVPGVELGDEFQYRVELAIVGIHRLYQAGIDYMKLDGQIVASSIVASGGYPDELDSADVLIYSGQGGNAKGKDKKPEDQKLERGNLALKNSILTKNPVRVIRGSKETKAVDSVDARGKVVTTYVYDGLYTVERYWQEVGSHDKLVYKFELRRIPGQPDLAWKEVKKSKQYKIREGICVNDISGGKEVMPICAVNTIDDDKPPPFNYITRMIYPDQYLPIPPKGCDCKGRCLDSRRCLCAVKNGGEIPYNFNGAIVEMKPLVYECGPSCKCPPSCYNRVSQHGIKFQLEIFKTESRGWGVRSLNSISSGSFICEYIGELLEDKEAEKRTGNDEYLFDIGQNYSDCSLKSDGKASSKEASEDDGFTIDAVQFGNVGRFINHSCSPNLYAQNVLFDHEDKRMPHIMLFAAENIPPLHELTYHYNYSVDQVHDSNGNIKMKSCYCGSAECTGRMY